MVTKMRASVAPSGCVPHVFICTAMCFLPHLANFSFCFAFGLILGLVFWLLTARISVNLDNFSAMIIIFANVYHNFLCSAPGPHDRSRFSKCSELKNYLW